MDTNEEGKIEELNKRLYDRDFKDQPISPRQRFKDIQPNVNAGWRHEMPTGPEVDFSKPRKITGSFFKKVLILASIFFVMSAGLLLFMLFGGWNVITSNRVGVAFLGPVSISAGSELDFDIVIENQNRSSIQNAILYIDYPDGTKRADTITQDLVHEKESIGEIASGATIRWTSRSVQFGELNAKREIKVTLEYGLVNSNATYRKEKNYEVIISSTPVTLTVDHPVEAVSGDLVEFRASIVSNSSVPLNNLLIKADYPFGFVFVDADPKPTYETNYWFLPTLKPGETKTITFRGQVQGQDGDERVVRFSIGAQSVQNEKTIATKYLSQTESLSLKKPPLALVISLDGNTNPQFTTHQGTMIRGAIDIVNNLPVEVVGAKVKLTLNGQLFDPTSVSGEGGFYYSIDKAVVWDKATLGRLARLEPGDSLSLNFQFTTLPTSATASKNSSMSISAIVTGDRVTDAGTVEPVSSSQDKKILAETAIGLISRAVYSIGPFRNRGLIPPKADTPTTYTVIWTVTNSLNDAQGAEVRAILPVNVKWLGVTSPQSEPVTWNQDKNEVVWRIGDLVARTGSDKPAREAAFQVELTPSQSQVGNPANLMSVSTMSAKDSFTSTLLSALGKELTTRLSTDPKYGGEEANIVR